MWILQIAGATALLELPSSVECSSVRTPFAAFAAANLGIALLLTLLIKRDYRRQARALPSAPPGPRCPPPGPRCQMGTPYG